MCDIPVSGACPPEFWNELSCQAAVHELPCGAEEAWLPLCHCEHLAPGEMPSCAWRLHSGRVTEDIPGGAVFRAACSPHWMASGTRVQRLLSPHLCVLTAEHGT